MKILRDVLRVLAVALAVVTLASFFLPVLWVHVEDASGVVTTVKLSGAELAFKADLSTQLGFGSEGTMFTFKSGWYFLSFFLSLITAAFMALGFKFNKSNGAALVFGLLNSILLLVIVLSPATTYADLGRLVPVGTPELSKIIYLIFGASVGAIAICTAGVLVKDKLEVLASQGTKKTIIQRIFKFFREYKSELKKVVWPGWRSVVKNTIVVLVMCGVVLLLIWLVDLGMGELFKLAYGIEDVSSVAAAAATA